MKGGKAQIQNTNIESKYRPDMHDNECASEGFSKWIVGVMNWKEVMLNCELHETYLTCMTMSMRGRGSAPWATMRGLVRRQQEPARQHRIQRGSAQAVAYGLTTWGDFTFWIYEDCRYEDVRILMLMMMRCCKPQTAVLLCCRSQCLKRSSLKKRKSLSVWSLG